MFVRATKGFTIVELLIVIVVIAILASISVVAYTGISERASNNQTISAASEWTKVLIAHATSTGDYPFTGSRSQTSPYATDTTTITHNYPCLGLYPGNVCASVTNTNVVGAGHTFVNTSWNNLILAENVDSLPQPSQRDISIGGQPHRGAYMSLVGYATNSTPPGTGPGLVFFLSGTSCPATVAGRSTQTLAGSGGVRCSIILPDFRS